MRAAESGGSETNVGRIQKCATKSVTEREVKNSKALQITAEYRYNV
jgi:hypothetical protein